MLYNEQTRQVKIEGEEKSWTRARLIKISNNLNQTPSIEFLEDTVTIKVDGSESHAGGETLKANFDPTGEFDLINPNDGTVIGKGTHQQLQVLIYSLYIKLANERDAKVSQKPADSTRPTG
jgi:hypothetical protein